MRARSPNDKPPTRPRLDAFEVGRWSKVIKDADIKVE